MGNNVFSTLSKNNYCKKKNSSKSNQSINIQNESEQLQYYLPNYVKDTDIMVILHFLGCYLFQSILSAPIENKFNQEDCKILDVG